MKTVKFTIKRNDQVFSKEKSERIIETPPSIMEMEVTPIFSEPVQEQEIRFYKTNYSLKEETAIGTTIQEGPGLVMEINSGTIVLPLGQVKNLHGFLGEFIDNVNNTIWD